MGNISAVKFVAQMRSLEVDHSAVGIREVSGNVLLLVTDWWRMYDDQSYCTFLKDETMLKLWDSFVGWNITLKIKSTTFFCLSYAMI